MDTQSQEQLIPQHAARAASAKPQDNTGTSEVLPSDQSPGPSSQPPIGRGRLLYVWSSWKLELLACLWVLATPLVILATVYPHAGQPLPEWPFKITINALLSIYNLIFKALISFLATSTLGQLQWKWFTTQRPLYDVVRFDAAGRGAWGSFLWICTNHFRQPLSTLGASILVLSLALDPFIQQIIRPADCLSSSGGLEQATLPRTNFFPADIHVYEATELGDLMRRALFHQSSVIEPNCPTGNCTFPEVFGTMGFCSSCKDSSAELSFETVCLANRKDHGKNMTYKIENPSGYYVCSNKSAIISSLPQRFYLNQYPKSWEASTLNVSFAPSLREIKDSELFKIALKNNTDYGTEQFIVVQALMGKTSFSDQHINIATGDNLTDCDAPDSEKTWQCRGYGAATCSLYPCVRIHSATVENGQLRESLVAHSGDQQLATPKYLDYLNNDSGDSLISTLDVECLSPEEAETIRAQGYTINKDVRWLPYNGSMHEEFFRLLLHRGCAYSLNRYFARDSTRDYFLKRYFSGQPVKPGGGLAVTHSDGSVDMLNSFYAEETTPLYLYNGGKVDFERIDTLFSNLSTTLTNYIRTHGNATYSAVAVGHVLHHATCLEVQWPWIALHASVSLLTLLLFFLVLGTTRQQPVWKASPLVWILHGPNDTGISGDLSTIDKMEEKSKRLTIHMS